MTIISLVAMHAYSRSRFVVFEHSEKWSVQRLVDFLKRGYGSLWATFERSWCLLHWFSSKKKKTKNKRGTLLQHCFGVIRDTPLQASVAFASRGAPEHCYWGRLVPSSLLLRADAPFAQQRSFGVDFFAAIIASLGTSRKYCSSSSIVLFNKAQRAQILAEP